MKIEGAGAFFLFCGYEKKEEEGAEKWKENQKR